MTKGKATWVFASWYIQETTNMQKNTFDLIT